MQSDDSGTLNIAPGTLNYRDSLVGSVLDGRFRIEKLIGTGGMSNVYKATQLPMNRFVAIKTLKFQVSEPVYEERFQREIELLCRINHPNIVTVYDALIAPSGQPCLVMDYLRGRSLEQLLEDDGPLSAEQCGRIFVQVCSALDYAHRHGIIHRDIKPGNIVLLHEDMDFVKVVDFGLSKINEEGRRLTQSGELWGSPPYMSPEQCSGKPDDERSDIYSLGIVIYEMLTGKDPFHTCTTVFELINAHVLTPPPAMQVINSQVRVPEALQSVVLKAIAKNPADRFQTASEFRDALARACLEPSECLGLGIAPRSSGLEDVMPETPAFNQYALSALEKKSSNELWLEERRGTRKTQTSARFGSGSIQPECSTCGKPVQQQRRGSMTAWILADHHEVMRKMSDVCSCTAAPGKNSSNSPLTVESAPDRAEDSSLFDNEPLFPDQGPVQRNDSTNPAEQVAKPWHKQTVKASAALFLFIAVLAGATCFGLRLISLSPSSSHSPGNYPSPAPDATSSMPAEATLTPAESASAKSDAGSRVSRESGQKPATRSPGPAGAVNEKLPPGKTDNDAPVLSNDRPIARTKQKPGMYSNPPKSKSKRAARTRTTSGAIPSPVKGSGPGQNRWDLLNKLR